MDGKCLVLGNIIAEYLLLLTPTYFPKPWGISGRFLAVVTIFHLVFFVSITQCIWFKHMELIQCTSHVGVENLRKSEELFSTLRLCGWLQSVLNVEMTAPLRYWLIAMGLTYFTLSLEIVFRLAVRGRVQWCSAHLQFSRSGFVVRILSLLLLGTVARNSKIKTSRRSAVPNDGDKAIHQA